MAVEGPGVLPFVRGIDLSKNDLHVSFMNYFSNKLRHKEDSQLVLQGKLKSSYQCQIRFMHVKCVLQRAYIPCLWLEK